MSDTTASDKKVGFDVVGNASAPFVYFDRAATYGLNGGTIQVELVAATILPDGAATKTQVVATCHLRCSPDAARSLIGSLNSALAMLEKPTDPLKTN